MKKGFVSKRKGVEAPGKNKQRVLKVGLKKRNSDPGIRHQGGRIYDSENGTTCHQCRQKTVEVKAACKEAKCNLNFCPRCLLNRYNEVVDVVRKLKKWKCPKCRRVCNCSFCRKKQGLKATGILTNIAKKAGFGSVSQLLEKNPNITTKMDEPACQNNGNALKSENGMEKKIRASSLSIRSARDFSGVDDARLSKSRCRKMPEPIELKIHNAKRSGKVLDIPQGIQEGTLLCVLEFFATFGEEALGLGEPDLLRLAQEIVSEKTSGSNAPVLENTMAQLKGIICDWYGYEDEKETPWDMWSVKKYSNKPVEEDQSFSARRKSARTASKGTSFWSLSVSHKLDIVSHLVHESLACGPIVHIIEERVEDTEELVERRKKQVNKIKEKMKQEQEEYLQKYIADLVSTNHMNNLSSEKQRDIVSIARENAIDSISEDTKARLRWATCQQQYFQSDPSARLLPVGEDRHGALYFWLKCSALISGEEGAIVRVMESSTECFIDIQSLQKCLELMGHREGVLKVGLSEIEQRLTK